MTTWIDAGVRADAGRGLQIVARAGYGAKSVVYCIVGVLSLMVAFGAGGRITGERGAVDALGAQLFGRALLWGVAVGLACYALWSVVRAVLDPEHRARGREGIFKRIGHAVSAIPHAVLAVYAGSRALGAGRSSSGRYMRLLGEAMSMPFGRMAVAIGGAIAIGFGLHEIYVAVKGEPEMQLETDRMGPMTQRVAQIVRRIGVGARGVVFAIIGLSFVVAARRANPREVKTMGEALTELSRGPLGDAVLTVVAFGLFAYGVHQYFVARYAALPRRV